MRKISLRLAPIALLALLLGSGCVIVESQADISFFWDYEGYDCIDAGVSQTLVQIWDGPYLEEEVYVPCDATGVTLEAFAPGDYTYYLAGLSPSGRTLYEASGAIHAHSGNNEYDVRLWFVGR